MRRVPALGLLICLVPFAAIRAEQPATRIDLGGLLGRVGAAVERYYARAQSLICLESVLIQPLNYDLMPDRSFPRQLQYELRVAWDEAASGESSPAMVQRELLKVNGRTPRPKDKPQCLDPTAVSPDTLAMLLPSEQSDFTFTVAGSTKFKNRPAVMVDYQPNQRERPGAELFEGREECFRITNIDGYIKGRIWVDAETDTVLRLDQRLSGFVDVTVPADRRRRRESLPVTVERLDSSIVFSAVTFDEPEETLTLPASVETVSVIRNSGSPRIRETRRFTNYRRFLTGGRVVVPE